MCVWRKCKLGAAVGVGSCKCPTKMLTFDSNWELEDLVFQLGAPPAYIQRSNLSPVFSLGNFPDLPSLQRPTYL